MDITDDHPILRKEEKLLILMGRQHPQDRAQKFGFAPSPAKCRKKGRKTN